MSRVLVLGAAAWLFALATMGPVSARQAQGTTTTGTEAGVAQTCASCHRREHAAWRAGRHSKMIQVASPAAVVGDFTARPLTLNGKRYEVRAADGRFFITESVFSGRATEHAVAFTLGSRRIQHYLTIVDRGRIVVLPPTWDVARREWFDNRDIVRPDEDLGTVVQQWNRNCVGCHVSGQDNHYDPASRAYATAWTDTGTSCERCHGPGTTHLARAGNGADLPDLARPDIVVPSRLDARASTAVCAQCHSLRDTLGIAFEPGADYDDHFLVKLEYGPQRTQDPAYWADGRPRRFSNDAVGLWQSQCYVKGGLTCVACHDAHTPDVDRHAALAPANNGLCTRCHQAIGARLAEHTRHEADSAGSACVECHMPRTVTSIKATMRDHTIGLPVPENTVAYGVPNACTGCHATQGAQWAVDRMRDWWPANRRQRYVRQAQAFTAARRGRPDATAALLAIAADSGTPPIVRANALGHLGRAGDARTVAALVAALESDHAVERMVAASSLRSPDTRQAVLRALDDPRRAVRVAALISLANTPGGSLSPAERVAFMRVTREFAARARLHEDDAAVQTDLGLVHLLAGDHAQAARALEISLGLEPALPKATLLLGLARVGQGRLDEARSLLKRVPPSDPGYRLAQDQLRTLPLKN